MLSLDFPRRTLPAIALSLCLLSPWVTRSVEAQGAEELGPYYQSVVDNYEANPVPADAQDWQAVDNLNGAAIAYRYLGDSETAWDLHQRALTIARAIGDRNREIGTLQNLGNTASQLGDDQGIAFYQSQLAYVRQQGDLELEAQILQFLSFGYLTIGDNAALVDLYDAYIPVLKQLESWDEVVYTLLGQSTLYYSYLSEPDTAFALLDEALTIAQQQNAPNLIQSVLVNQAVLHRIEGNTGKLIQLYQQALELAIQSGDDSDQLRLRQQLAHAYEGQDRIPESIALLETNLILARQQGDRHWVAWTMDDLSFAYRQLEAYEQALNWQQQALAQHRQLSAQGASNFNEINAYNNLGWIYLALGDWPQAEQALRQAIQGYEATSRDLQENQGLFGQSNDDLQVNFQEGYVDAYQALQEVLVAQGNVEEALEVAEQGRARSIVNLLALKTTSERTPQVTPPDITQMQAIARSHNTTLVEYTILYDKPRRTFHNRFNRRPWEKALLIWVVQPTGEVTLRQVDLRPLWQQRDRSLPLDTPLITLIKQSREALGIAERGITVVSRVDTPSLDAPIPQLQRLHQLLIDPIADLLPTDPTARVTFIPQDVLFFTPFAALEDEAGTFLIERHTILSAPSIQFLALTQARKQQLETQSTTAKTAVVVGNPIMPAIAAEPNGPLQPLPPLPGAEREAEAIARLLNTDPLIGGEATEVAVVEKFPDANIIHLATHGLLDDIYGFQSALAFTPGGGEDGLLKTREIINFDLQAELVVLSACDTGRGRLTGDGVIGLSRAFIGAGVPSIVVSLWVVPDAPTAELMTEFYEQLAQGQDKAQSLRLAMLKTMAEYPDPRNWAAFTLIGEAE